MLIVVRHGQTQPNADGLLLGRADPPLTELGERQAEALGAALGPARVISSPLQRARRTAAAFGLPVEVDDRWVELDYGQLEGRPTASVADDLWERWRVDPDFVPAGGESLAALGARVRDACETLAEEATGHDVVVVTHVSPIKASVAWALGVGDEVAWRLFVADASVCRIGFVTSRTQLWAFNEVHPPPAPPT